MKRKPLPRGHSTQDRLSYWTLTDQNTDCIEWQGARSPSGYGIINREGKTYRAHRVAWELSRGDIPKGMNVLHRCDNPPCCNVGHLFLGTKADNSKDMVLKGRHRNGLMLGISNPACKLSDEDVRQIKETQSRSKRVGALLARRFGVSKTVINAIKRGELWKHISPPKEVQVIIEEGN